MNLKKIIEMLTKYIISENFVTETIFKIKKNKCRRKLYYLILCRKITCMIKLFFTNYIYLKFILTYVICYVYIYIAFFMILALGISGHVNVLICAIFGEFNGVFVQF